MLNFNFRFTATTLLVLLVAVTAQGGGLQSNSASVETVLRHIHEDGRANTNFSVGGFFYSSTSPRDFSDGDITVFQNGDMFVNTASCKTLSNGEYEFTDGTKQKILNVFEMSSSCETADACIIRALVSTDINQDKLSDIVIKMVSLNNGREWSQTYLAVGDGKFVSSN